MKLSTRSRYGARILMELSRHLNEGPIQVNEIAKTQNIPEKYLEQLIRPLKEAGLVNSIRGPKGGHMLSKPPEQISLGDVVRIFECHPELVECVFSPEKCDRSEACRIRPAWEKATKALYESLDTVTIAELSKDKDPCI